MVQGLTGAGRGEARGAGHHAHAVVIQHRVDLAAAGGAEGNTSLRTDMNSRFPSTANCCHNQLHACMCQHVSAHTSEAPTSRCSVARPPGTGMGSATCNTQRTIVEQGEDLTLSVAATVDITPLWHVPPLQKFHLTGCAKPGVAATLPKSRVALPMVAGGFCALPRSGACSEWEGWQERHRS